MIYLPQVLITSIWMVFEVYVDLLDGESMKDLGTESPASHLNSNSAKKITFVACYLHHHDFLVKLCFDVHRILCTWRLTLKMFLFSSICFKLALSSKLSTGWTLVSINFMKCIESATTLMWDNFPFRIPLLCFPQKCSRSISVAFRKFVRGRYTRIPSCLLSSLPKSTHFLQNPPLVHLE